MQKAEDFYTGVYYCLEPEKNCSIAAGRAIKKEKLPFYPRLIRKNFTRIRIKQLPERRAINTLRTERLPIILIYKLMCHIIYANTTAYLFTLNEERQYRRTNKIQMLSQLTYFYINVQTLRKEINVHLVMTMILVKIYFLRLHIHFSIIIIQTGFIPNQTTVTYHNMTYITFVNTNSTSNWNIRINLSAML
jgi:hypothetical protein